MSAGPLAGRRILITRRPEQSSALREKLQALGAVVLEAPAIELAAPEDTQPLDAALQQLRRYHWLLFTSPNGVRFVRERMTDLGVPADLAAAGLRIGSVGPSTTEAFRSHFSGQAVDVEPESDYRAEGLLAALGDVSSQAILFPTSDRARDVLPTTLRARGAHVDVVVAYRTLVSPELRLRLETALAERPDIVAFASPSAVEGFVSTLGERARGLPVAVMGPITAAAARAAGMDVRTVATPSTLESLVSALVAVLGDVPPPANP